MRDSSKYLLPIDPRIFEVELLKYRRALRASPTTTEVNQKYPQNPSSPNTMGVRKIVVKTNRPSASSANYARSFSPLPNGTDTTNTSKRFRILTIAHTLINLLSQSHQIQTI